MPRDWAKVVCVGLVFADKMDDRTDYHRQVPF